ncbi:hypothetical protein [Ruminococcus sp. NK3A76]|uniref:hypothetical protein n=1 Tax=Ruminococcus sp. NK3A76 TaxID=877411 RepID=UPI00048FB13A|nr:hypothetical protein [Ruminococcus sp. NK3A76]
MKDKAFKVSLCGVTSALALFIMFLSGVFPMLDYALPMYAGFTMVVVIVEADRKWAIMTYISVSILCLFLTPNYQASLLFILFMGYYPILRYSLENIPIRPISLLIKFLVYNAAIIVYYNIFTKLFTGVDFTEDLGWLGEYSIYAMWGFANVLFVVYDYLLGELTGIYMNWFRKKILGRK